MGVDNLKQALPEYAKDLKLNLGSITRSTVLNEEQLWGTLLASAAATRNAQVLAEIGGAYDDLRPGLRMNIIGNPGVDKSHFELWCFAVSSINGCPDCVTAHEHTLREAGVDRETILEALKSAAIVAGVAQAITTAQCLATAG
jgi:alkyl hydroperoxide reductase subunit D